MNIFGFPVFNLIDYTSKEDADITKQWLTEFTERVQFGDEKIALACCPFRENVVIRKGYVPETFAGLENEQFAFVNLDMNLHRPQLAALRFFIPRRAKGGIILVHDYYDVYLPGVKQAVDAVAQDYHFFRIPTSDPITIALVGFEKR